MASATASSNYTASASAAASANYATTINFNDNKTPKFSEYRSRVMLGDLPQDFLRVQIIQAQVYDPNGYGMRQAYPPISQQQIQQNPNFLGFLTLTIAEAKLVKGSGLLGLMKMDPYVRFRIGHVSYETETAPNGGKNPQWRASYRINVFKGMDRINLEVFDQRNFTEDSFIGECEILIPREVMEGETRQHWYPLMGRQTNANENQGDILIVMSFQKKTDQIIPNRNDSPTRATNRSPVAVNTSATPVVNPNGNINASSEVTAFSLPPQSNNRIDQQPIPQHSPSAIPKPPPPPYSQEDIRTIEEMFPTVDRRTIIDLLDQHNGNKDLVVNQLLQNIA